jgi:hypothetical protein
MSRAASARFVYLKLERRVRGMIDGRNALRFWNDFPNEGQSWTAMPPRHRCHSGDVASGPFEARYETGFDGVGTEWKNNRNTASRRFRSPDSGRRCGHDDINSKPREFGRKSRKSLELAISEPPNELDVRAFHVPEFVETLRKLLPPISHSRFGGRAQNADPGNAS